MVAGVEMIPEWEDAPHQWVVKSVNTYQLAIEYMQKTVQAVIRTYMEM